MCVCVCVCLCVCVCVCVCVRAQMCVFMSVGTNFLSSFSAPAIADRYSSFCRGVTAMARERCDEEGAFLDGQQMFVGMGAYLFAAL